MVSTESPLKGANRSSTTATPGVNAWASEKTSRSEVRERETEQSGVRSNPERKRDDGDQ